METSRSEIIKSIMAEINPGDIVVTSTGYISREVFRQEDRDLNFYMMGSMGNALALGLGIALSVENKVVVIAGDGAALMGLNQMVTAEKMNLQNLQFIILDNGCHESTGGQPTASDCVAFSAIYSNTKVYKCKKDSDVPPRITLAPHEITTRFRNAIHHCCIKK